MYQPSTRMYIHNPVYSLYQFGHACHANLVYFRSNEINHQRTHVAAVVCIVRVMTTAGSTRARIISTTPTIRPAFACIELPREQQSPVLTTSALLASVPPSITRMRLTSTVGGEGAGGKLQYVVVCFHFHFHFQLLNLLSLIKRDRRFS